MCKYLCSGMRVHYDDANSVMLRGKRKLQNIFGHMRGIPCINLQKQAVKMYSKFRSINIIAMDRALPMLASQIIIFTLLSSLFALNLVSAESNEYAKTLKRKQFGLKKEKLSHFRLYWHDIYSGIKPTAARVVSPVPVNSTTAFGSIAMIDNPLTLGPELSSKWVGKAQGFYASAAQEELALLMGMSFAFTEGKYSGSTINILGRNPVFDKERELPVIGGTGLFRFARGYAKLNTSRVDLATGDATVEYNIYVLHY